MSAVVWTDIPAKRVPSPCSWVRSVLCRLALLFLFGRVIVGHAANAPVISSFAPTSGPVGTLVIISGNNLSAVSAISFNGVNAPVYGSSVDGTAVQTEVPANASTGPISLSTDTGLTTSLQDFVVTTAAPPLVTGFSPTSGSLGSTVTILGSNLVQVTAVEFNGVAAQFSTTQGLTAVVPAAAATGPLTVTTAAGSFTTSSNFVVAASALPSISSFSPQSGPPGTVVTISGARFQDLTSVTFGGVPSTAASALVDTQISATVPREAKSGLIGVTTKAGTTLSLNSFSVVPLAPPVITNVAPSAGAPGDHVLLYGDNLSFVQTVEFNGISAQFSTLAPNQLSVTVPATSTGPISITTDGGAFTTLASFVVLGGLPAPAILGVSSWSGPPGLVVSLTTTNLGSPTAVTFNGVAADFTSYGNVINAVIPSLATSGAIEIKGVGGLAKSTQPFTVYSSGELALFAWSSDATIPMGSNVVLSLLITNRSPNTINNLVLSSHLASGQPHSGPLVLWTNGAPAFGDVTPADVQFTSLNLDQGTSVLTNNELICHLGSIPPGHALQCDLEVTPKTPDSLHLLAFLRGDLADSTSAYASVLESVLVTGTVELTVSAIDPTHLQISWVDANASLKLQSSADPARSADWTDVPGPVQRSATKSLVTLPISSIVEFFRLVHAGP